MSLNAIGPRRKVSCRFAVRATLEAIEPRVLFSGLNVAYDAHGVASITYNNTQIFGYQLSSGGYPMMTPDRWIIGNTTDSTWVFPTPVWNGSTTSPVWTYNNFNIGNTGVNATFRTAVTTASTADYDSVNFTFTVTNNQPLSDASNPAKAIDGFDFQLPYLTQPGNGSNYKYADRQLFQSFQIFNQRDYTQSNGNGGLFTLVNTTPAAKSGGLASHTFDSFTPGGSFPTITFGTIGEGLDNLIYTPDAILPQQTKTYSLSLRFSANTATAENLAGPELRDYATAYPDTVNWDDRRAIYQSTLSSPSVATAQNPRGWLTASFTKVDLTTPSTLLQNQDRFYTQLVQAIDGVVNRALSANAQAVSIWDIEGGEFPAVHYYGNPDLYSRVPASFAPEMFHIAPGYSLPLYKQVFREITDAGLRAGVTLRPFDLEFNEAQRTLTPAADWESTQLDPAKISAAVAYLSEQIDWASNPDNLGATIFYIDSLGFYETEIVSQLHALHPDVLLIPEHGSGRMYADSLPYAEYRQNYTGVPEAVRVAYPAAASAARASDGTPGATEIANSAAGDISIFPENRDDSGPYLAAYGTVDGAATTTTGQTYVLDLSTAAGVKKKTNTRRTMMGGFWLIDWEGTGQWTSYGSAGQYAPTSVSHTYTVVNSQPTTYTVTARYFARDWNAKLDKNITREQYYAGLTATGQVAANKKFVQSSFALNVVPFSQVTVPSSPDSTPDSTSGAMPGSTPDSTSDSPPAAGVPDVSDTSPAAPSGSDTSSTPDLPGVSKTPDESDTSAAPTPDPVVVRICDGPLPMYPPDPARKKFVISHRAA